MEQFPNTTPKKENLKVSNQEKGIGEIFKMFPDIENIGSKEEYLEYLNSFFPESVVKDIVWHAGGKDIQEFKTKKDEGYKKSDLWTENGIYFTGSLSHAKKYLSGLGYGNLIKPVINLIKYGSVYDKNKALYGTLVNITNPIINNRKEERSKYLPKTLDKIRDVDLDLITQDGKDGIVFNELHKKDALFYAIVFDPKQVHILGSEEDINQFKEFIENKKGNPDPQPSA